MEIETSKPKASPKDFFLNLGAIVFLYSGVMNLMNLFFSIIDKVNPDPINPSYGYEADGIRWSIAVLIIFYPLYIYFTKLLAKDIAIDPSKKNLGIRKWLIYFTLFVTGLIIAWGFVYLLNGFLGGELTSNFIMKAISAGIVLLLIFEYYLMDLRENHSYNKRIFYTATLVVLLGIAGGFYEMGSPATQRMMRFDTTRVGDLQNLQWQVVNFWQQKGTIPLSQDELSDSISGFYPPSDPETKQPYIYEKTSDTGFKLCAVFNLKDKNDRYNETAVPAVYIEKSMYAGKTESWNHEKGSYCFERTIDTQLYPPKITPAVPQI